LTGPNAGARAAKRPPGIPPKSPNGLSHNPDEPANTLAGFLAARSVPNTLLIPGIAAIAFSFLSRIKEEHLLD
jgi:hypothetical protein